MDVQNVGRSYHLYIERATRGAQTTAYFGRLYDNTTT